MRAGRRYRRANILKAKKAIKKAFELQQAARVYIRGSTLHLPHQLGPDAQRSHRLAEANMMPYYPLGVYATARR